MPNILQLCKQCWSRRCCILLRRTLAHIKERDHAVDIPQTYLAATSHVPPPPRGEVDTTIQRHNGADPMLRTERQGAVCSCSCKCSHGHCQLDTRSSIGVWQKQPNQTNGDILLAFMLQKAAGPAIAPICVRVENMYFSTLKSKISISYFYHICNTMHK